MQLYFSLLSRSMKRCPELWLCALLSVFYFYYSYSAGMGRLDSILLQVPILALNYILIRWGLRHISYRLSQAEFRPSVESIGSFLFLFGLLFLLLWQKNYTLLYLGICLFLWLALQLYLRHLGAFYVGFVALLFFTLTSLSYYLLYWERQALQAILDTMDIQK